LNSEPAREDNIAAWMLSASTGDVAATLDGVDVNIGLSNIMADDMRYKGGMDDHLSVRYTVAELNGRNAMSFYGEIKRYQVQRFLDLFRENVMNFHIGDGEILRAVDDGEA